MGLFLSTFINKLDKKGRISVPATFRASLSEQSFQGIIIFKSNTHNALEGFGIDYMEGLSERLDSFDLFSENQDDLTTAIFAESRQLPFDGDGRVMLPKDLCDLCGIDEKAAFVGLGKKFQIWNPEDLENRVQEARKNVQDKGLTIPGVGGSK